MVQIVRRFARLWISLAIVFCFALGTAAQVSPDLFSGLQWRNVGPYHGGRIASVTGVIGEPGTFYVGIAARRDLENHQRRYDVVSDI